MPQDRVEFAIPNASLERSGEEVVLTGSVDYLFDNAVFAGPNRSAKQDRALPKVDVLAMARSFTEMRIQLASLHQPPPDPTDAPMTRIATPAALDQLEDGPRMSIASLDPAFVSALDAIEAADRANGPGIPLPLAIPESLAYARANAPSVVEQPNPFSEQELYCLATAVYFEARGESYRGQVGVAQVVMNRVAHDLYPGTICGVVYQNASWRNRCQFSFACDGRSERITEPEPWRQAQEIADKVTRDQLYLSDVANATHYHASYVYPHWAPRMTRMTKIGLHIFYKFRGR
jgi:spore germination cell wall hydrolase CwlJ-like protein